MIFTSGSWRSGSAPAGGSALRRRVTAAQPAPLTAPSLRSTGPLPLAAGAVLAQALAPDALPRAAGGPDSQGAPGE